MYYKIIVAFEYLLKNNLTIEDLDIEDILFNLEIKNEIKQKNPFS